MVCRECGAYNAEHLSHCRVCAARLRDNDDEPATEKSVQEESAGKPARGFVHAPSWPTKPYEGAPDKPVYTPPTPPAAAKRAEPEAPEDDEYESDLGKEPIAPAAPAYAPAERESAAPAYTPAAASVRTRASARSERPAVRESAPARVCSACGKAMLPDAPFCAYCGSHEGLPGAEKTAVTPRRAATPRLEQSAAHMEKKHMEPVKPKKSAKLSHKSRRDEDPDEDDFDEDDLFEEDLPKPMTKNKASLRKKGDDFLDDDDDDDFDDDDFDDDDDDFDDGGKKKRGKGTTILFWALILLLVALIGVFGVYIVKKNYGGDFNNLIASITGKAAEPEGETPTGGDAEAGESGAETPVEDSKMYTAEISEDVDAASGTEVYVIDVYAPTGSTVKINTTTELMNNGETVIPSNNHVILHVPRAAFLPGAPVDTESITITPDISVITADGQTVPLSVPAVTKTVDKCYVTVELPETESVANTYDNAAISIMGTVGVSDTPDHTVKVSVNGTECTVYEGGMFQTTYQPTGGAEAETITIEATKDNCMTATKVITVEPFVQTDATIAITNDPTVVNKESRGNLVADKDGAVTVTGTVTPGSTVTAVCSDTSVKFSDATVDAAGAFSLPVTLSKGGVFTATVTVAHEGFTDGTATVVLERVPNDSSSKYLKSCKQLKTEQYTSVKDGTATEGDYYFSGKVTEVVASAPYEVVKMTLSSGEEVIVTNRSLGNRLNADDIGKSKKVAGSIAGTYADTGLPHLWVWYTWNNN